MLKTVMLGLVLAAAALSGAVSVADAETVPSPLQQVRDGVPTSEVMCSEDHVLMVSQTGIPACVFEESVLELETRGFEFIGEPFDMFPIKSSDMADSTLWTGDPPPVITMSRLPNIGETAIVEINFTNAVWGDVTDTERYRIKFFETGWKVTSKFEIVDSGGLKYEPIHRYETNEITGYRYTEFTPLNAGESKTYRIEVRAVEEGKSAVSAFGYGEEAAIVMYLDDEETMLAQDHMARYPEMHERTARTVSDKDQPPKPLTDEEIRALEQNVRELTHEELVEFITIYVRDEQLSIEWALDNLLLPFGPLNMTEVRQVLSDAGYSDGEIDDAVSQHQFTRPLTRDTSVDGPEFAVTGADASSPLQQVNQGVPLGQIQCNDSKILLLSPTAKPACVNEHSVEKLKDRGFRLTVTVEPAASHEGEQLPPLRRGTSDTLTEPQDSTSQATEPQTRLTQSEEFEVIDIAVDRNMTKSDLPKVVDVGMTVMDLGTFQYNEKYTMAYYGMNDFNNYLEEIGAPWRMNLVFEGIGLDDTMEAIKSLDSNGVKFVLGPTPSADIHHIKSYVHSNDMVLISSWSTTTSLAVADNIFRFAPDTSQQGNVLALLFEHEGIEAVVPIYRGDAWGDGIYESAKNTFEAMGGVMDDGMRYSPESVASAYYVNASMLSDLVDKYTDQYPTDKVAVLMIGLSETVHLLGFADSFDNLDSVRWFGSDASSKYHVLSDDPAASAFLQDVGYVGTIFGTSRNDVYVDVLEYFEPYSASAPSPYSFSIYDSIWVLGKTILETDSVDPLTVRDAITDVASKHTGAIGTINLNEFGDFATPNYDLWSVRDGQWYVSGHFDADSGTFNFT